MKFVQTNGNFGEEPEWVGLIKAARYLNVPPWELAKQHYLWTDYALVMRAIRADDLEYDHSQQAYGQQDIQGQGQRF